ncbi:radical SAM protein [Desulfonatronovibrio magnus]|uniref:radical SAM protein n=1 Tax=Desulfonatronovibrio magnus TaxID=698827 RepID=UPI0005EB407D|nr:radical SAM protein [Desulfonatronovibrio magnus]
MQEINVTFTHSGENIEVFVEELKNAVLGFLDLYGEPAFLGQEFCRILGTENRFSNLLHVAGMSEYDFFKTVISQLEPANHKSETRVFAGDIELPKRFLLPILEVIIPGDTLCGIKDVATYEQLTNVSVPEDEREDLQKVIDKYPVRLSKHVIRQSRISKHVAYQFMPFVEELDESGLRNTWVGQFHKGLLEQMYQNRPIFVLHMSCPVYCRFCFRKHKDCRNLPTPKIKDVLTALEHIKNSPRIKEIVLTGGEPLLNKDTLTCAIEGLEQIPHIQTIRIASRCISYYPQLFYAHESFWLEYLTEKSRSLQADNKRIEIATHFIHPDEISHYSLDIISKLVSNGVGVYTQTPFLNNCNDSGQELTSLYNELRGAGSEIHYVYIPCSPIQGNKVYWTPISAGHKAAAYMRAYLSDRAIPIICTATRIGKIDWNTSGWAVEPSREYSGKIWIRSPYTQEYFREFAPQFELKEARVNSAGTLDSAFMAEIGDESLYLGSITEHAAPARPFKQENLEFLQKETIKDQRLPFSIVNTGIPALKRPHLTTVEMDIQALEDFRDAMNYISEHTELTDVILTPRKSLLDCVEMLPMYAKELQLIPHIRAMRVRSLTFAYQPDLFSDEVVDTIAGLNLLNASSPTRVELETQFIHSSEIQEVHGHLIRNFLSKGVTVYNNILLLSGINDNEDEMKKICYKCRQIGIELLLLYTAGMPVQEKWNASSPVDATTVIHIATNLRRHQSGREVPLYAVKTPLGDADFNFTARIVKAEIPDSSDPDKNEGSVWMKLLPYSLSYYRKIDPDYHWPQGVSEQDGHPVIEVKGLTVASNRHFFLRE